MQPTGLGGVGFEGELALQLGGVAAWLCSLPGSLPTCARPLCVVCSISPSLILSQCRVASLASVPPLTKSLKGPVLVCVEEEAEEVDCPVQ